MTQVKIEYDDTWETNFAKKVNENGPWDNFRMFQMAYENQKSAVIDDFKALQSLKYIPKLTPLPHQIDVTKKVINEMNGKAILADEVGLGKTIEAGLILKEYMVRGLVKKVLVLAPASLNSQWVQELNQKFFIPAVQHKKSYVIEQYDVVVTSMDTAKRNPHKEAIYKQNYDMIIIDEAHKLKNNKTKNYAFVQSLKKKFCLLLTATPIQNSIDEVFNLVSLLKPGHLGNYDRFKESFLHGKNAVRNDEYLKELINKVMVRNKRSETGLEWTNRNVHTIHVDFTEEEKEVYDQISKLKGHHSFSVLTMQREICSSKEALFLTLKKMLEKDRVEDRTKEFCETLIQKIQMMNINSKAEKLYELIQKADDKVIVFTEYKGTQLYLQWYLKQKGILAVPFNGKFKKSKRDWMKQLFKDKAQVLIATEAGGEGINLQFCHHVVNYDLPWNPMKLEQRIGRVHRLGQENDVHVYNFSVNDTVEDKILELLYKKIGVFETVIGELDEILTKYEINDVGKYIKEIYETSESEEEIEVKMDNLIEIFKIDKQKLEEFRHETKRSS